MVFQVGERDTTIYDVKELLGATGWRKNPREANQGTEGLFGGYYGSQASGEVNLPGEGAGRLHRSVPSGLALQY